MAYRYLRLYRRVPRYRRRMRYRRRLWRSDDFSGYVGSKRRTRLNRTATVMKALGQLGGKSEATVNKGLATLAQMNLTPRTALQYVNLDTPAMYIQRTGTPTI